MNCSKGEFKNIPFKYPVITVYIFCFLFFGAMVWLGMAAQDSGDKRSNIYRINVGDGDVIKAIKLGGEYLCTYKPFRRDAFEIDCDKYDIIKHKLNNISHRINNE